MYDDVRVFRKKLPLAASARAKSRGFESSERSESFSGARETKLDRDFIQKVKKSLLFFLADSSERWMISRRHAVKVSLFYIMYCNTRRLARIKTRD